MKKFVLKEEKRRRKQQTANSKQRDSGSAIRNPQSALGFRRFRPALRAVVQTQGGRPAEVNAWDKNRSVYGKVVGLAGPWRTTGDWWRADMWARDEWDVAIGSKGAPHSQTLYRLYRELKSGQWFVEGTYD